MQFVLIFYHCQITIVIPPINPISPPPTLYLSIVPSALPLFLPLMSVYSYTLSTPQTAYHPASTPHATIPHPINPLRPPKGRHSDAIRMQALAVYAESGNQAAVERELGIDRTVVNRWVNDEATPALLDELRSTVRHQHGWRFVKLLGDTLDVVETALKDGDEVVLKNGQRVNKRISGKDATVMASILTDKWMLISGSLSQSSTIVQGLDLIHREVKSLGASLTHGAPLEAKVGETLGEGEKLQPPLCIDNNSNGLTLSDIGG